MAAPRMSQGPCAGETGGASPLEKATLTTGGGTAAVPVFLLSLKAGGTGLNLTAADTVVHFDPWWNPAAEAQAIDRTHRIGQTQPVVAHRLVAADTVEQKILALQKDKAALAKLRTTLDQQASVLDKAAHEVLAEAGHTSPCPLCRGLLTRKTCLVDISRLVPTAVSF